MLFPKTILSAALSATLCILLVCVTAQNDTSGPTTPCQAVLDCLATELPCDLLPVPPRSYSSRFTGPFSTTQLRPGVFLYRDATYMSLVLFSKRRLMLVDVPDSNAGSNTPDGTMTHLTNVTENLLNGTRPFRIDIVYSHAHMDHIGKSNAYVRWARRAYPGISIQVYGTRDVRELIQRSSKRAVAWPNRLVLNERLIPFSANITVTLKLIGGHSGNDLLVYIRPQNKQPGVVMMVDTVYPKWAPFPFLAGAHDISKVMDAHDIALELDFEFFVPGHPEMASRDDITEGKHFLRELREEALKAIAEHPTAEEQKQAGASRFFEPGALEFQNRWFLAGKASRDFQVRACARAMIKKWGCRIGGVAQTAYSHCYSMIGYVSIDS